MLEAFGVLRKVYWEASVGMRYFVASSGNVTDEVIAEYIEKQSQLVPEASNEDFKVEELWLNSIR
jgi:REP element-mobilizing transposase RayT